MGGAWLLIWKSDVQVFKRWRRYHLSFYICMHIIYAALVCWALISLGLSKCVICAGCGSVCVVDVCWVWLCVCCKRLCIDMACVHASAYLCSSLRGPQWRWTRCTRQFAPCCRCWATIAASASTSSKDSHPSCSSSPPPSTKNFVISCRYAPAP